VASDLRLIVSVVKVLNEFERVGDLALRVVRRGPAIPRRCGPIRGCTTCSL
jgi:hypothetical protein